MILCISFPFINNNLKKELCNLDDGIYVRVFQDIARCRSYYCFFL